MLTSSTRFFRQFCAPRRPRITTTFRKHISSMTTTYKTGFDFSGMNKNVSPGDDFYEYAVGKWRAENKIPEGHSRWSVFNEIVKRNTLRIRDLLAEDFEITSTSDAALQTFYKSFLDLERQDADGIQPIASVLSMIDNNMQRTAASVLETAGKLHSLGVPVLFSLSAQPHPRVNSHHVATIHQGGLNLRDYEIYLERFDTDANKNAHKRSEYLSYLQTITTEAALEEEEKKNKSADGSFRVEKSIAETYWTKEESRDVDKTTNVYESTAEFCDYFGVSAELLQSFFLDGCGIEVPTKYNVANPPQLKHIFTMLNGAADGEFFDDLRAYFRLSVVDSFASALGSKLHDAHFHMYSTVMQGIESPKPLSERAVEKCSVLLGDALGKLYCRTFFPPSEKARVDEMVAYIVETMIARIDQLDWMSPSTKKYAQEKVRRMAVQVGHPSDGHWKEYENVVVGDSLGANTLALSEYAARYDLAKIGRAVDRDDWPWPPQTVNACNMPDLNTINFPAGILQSPFFTDDVAVSFGAFGMVISHEAVHSFDDQGAKYDYSGNLKDWWTPEDTQKFAEHGEVIVKQFDAYQVSFADGQSMNVRGKLCLGENIADIGGLKIAYQAFQKYQQDHPLEVIEGFTPNQRFFLGYAQVWRYLITDELARMHIANDPHSPPRWRVNGVVSQMEEFRRDFQLADDIKMAVVAEHKSHLWN